MTKACLDRASAKVNTPKREAYEAISELAQMLYGAGYSEEFFSCFILAQIFEPLGLDEYGDFPKEACPAVVKKAKELMRDPSLIERFAWQLSANPRAHLQAGAWR